MRTNRKEAGIRAEHFTRPQRIESPLPAELAEETHLVGR